MPRPDDNASQDETVKPAVVHRPTDSGVDLPPGRSAAELAEEDYRAVEMDEPGGGAAPGTPEPPPADAGTP